MRHSKLRGLCGRETSWRPSILALSFGIGTLGLGSPVLAAQDSDEGQVQDIVVTANKSAAQKVLEAPVSIQAIGGDELKKTGAVGFLDIATKIPGLSVEDLGPGDRKYVIRGINSTGQPTVGVYYDEAVISGANANDGGGLQADIKLFDLDHVEVLRGPQGTLYGASSMSGTIRFITRKPDLNGVGGYITGEISSTSHGGRNYGGNAALNLPIVDGKLGVRLVGWAQSDSGFVDQIRVGSIGLLRGVNNDVVTGGRINLRFQPTPDFTIDASITRQIERSDGSSRYTPAEVTAFSGPGVPPVQGCDLCNTDVVRSPWDDRLRVLSLTASYEMKSGTLTGTINQFRRDIDFNFDSTPILFAFGVPAAAVTMEPRKQNISSMEIRYASRFDFPVNFVIGGFRQRQDNNLTVEVVRTNGLGLPADVFSILKSDDYDLHPATGNTLFGRKDSRRATQYAGFGEITWNATPKLKLVGGLRYFSEKIEGSASATHPFFGGYLPGEAPPTEIITGASFSKLTYKLNASYDFGRALLIYATAAQGFRGGGLNAQGDPFVTVPGSFGPDSLQSYEIGLKGKLFGGRLQYQVDGYYIIWADIQAQQTTPDGGFVYIGNSGQARVKGFEFEFNASPVEHLNVHFSGSYQNAYLSQGASAEQKALNPTLGVTGEKIPNVAPFQYNFGINYTVPLVNDVSTTFSVDFSHRGKTNSYFSSNPFNISLKSYGLLNLRAALTAGPWTATVFLRNVTNERAQISAINSSQDPSAMLTVRPRTVGMSVTRTF